MAQMDFKHVYAQQRCQKKVLQVVAVLAFLVTTYAMNSLFLEQVGSLQAWPKDTAELLKECLGNFSGQPLLAPSLTAICTEVERECFQDSNQTYHECVEESLEQRMGDIGKLRADEWYFLRWMICGLCCVSTFVHCYCGIFSTYLGRNKALVAYFMLANAIMVGFCANGFLDHMSSNARFYFAMPIPFLLLSGISGAVMLQKLAMLDALPADEMTAMEMGYQATTAGERAGTHSSRRKTASALSMAEMKSDDATQTKSVQGVEV